MLELARDGETSSNEDPGAVFAPINIMGDRRVYRGTVFGAQQATTTPPESSGRRKHGRKRRTSKPSHLETLAEIHRRTQVVPIRRKIPLHLYLEEQGGDGPETSVQMLQTDTFFDRCDTLGYVPDKLGMDIGTQVDPGSGDLFLFDVAVEPILRVLVGKTIEQSLLEVSLETEMADIGRRKAKAQAALAQIQSEVREQEQEALNRQSKKEAIFEAERMRIRASETAVQKVQAQFLARSFLFNQIPSLFESLSARQYFYDRSQVEIEQTFMPWLINNVQGQVRRNYIAHQLLDNMLRTAIIRRERTQATESEEARLERSRINALPLRVDVSIRSTYNVDDN